MSRRRRRVPGVPLVIAVGPLPGTLHWHDERSGLVVPRRRWKLVSVYGRCPWCRSQRRQEREPFQPGYCSGRCEDGARLAAQDVELAA